MALPLLAACQGGTPGIAAGPHVARHLPECSGLEAAPKSLLLTPGSWVWPPCEEQARGGLSTGLLYLEGSHEAGGEDKKTRGNGHRLHQERFCADIRKNFFTVGIIN